MQPVILHLLSGLHRPLESIRIPSLQYKHSPVFGSNFAQFSCSILAHSRLLLTGLYPSMQVSHTPSDEYIMQFSTFFDGSLHYPVNIPAYDS